MVQFFKDPEKRVLNPELFSKDAEEMAGKIHNSSHGLDSNNKSQLRKFFDEVLRLNSLAKSNPDDWENIQPYVNMLIAKTVYAEGRKKVTPEFVAMMKHCINKVKHAEDLDVFSSYFEAFIGFYSILNKR